jgi:arylsulfatase A
MNKEIKKWIILILTIEFLLTGTDSEAIEMYSQRPNIVLVIADDLGWRQLGCYGSNFYKSPNIDKLMLGGIRFSDAYASAPVCSPTRASIMTGKYPARLHLTDYVQAPDNQNKPIKVHHRQKFLPLEEKTIGEIFKENGYCTALFGKWHLSLGKSGPSTIPYNPDKQGFDETFLTYKPSPDLPLGVWQKPELDGHNTDTITNRVIEFINRNKQNSFLVIAAYDAVHDPLMERESTIAKYIATDGSKLPENNPVLAAMIERMDNGIGRITDCLDSNNIAENTVVIFVSDNGGLEKDASQQPLKHGKGWLYEGGIRVPFSVSWKGKIPAGQKSSFPVTSVDVLPTLMELANIHIDSADFDGISLVPLFTEKKLPNRKAIYWHYPHYHNGPPAAAIRSGNYKLIEWYEKSLLNKEEAYELYDLNNDISEQFNLANELPQKVITLKEELNKWRNSVNSNLPFYEVE